MENLKNTLTHLSVTRVREALDFAELPRKDRLSQINHSLAVSLLGLFQIATVLPAHTYPP